MDIVLSPTAAYLVDLMHSRSAEALAAHQSVEFFKKNGNTSLTWY